ncbi:putative acyl-activating enzyme 19 isoform X1 [Cucumis melo var. makuwa]|uniref:Acyl-activating enzyme 19 isoform X1 n=1 Tax=Cucumis melo var. makuwa TaxID=1194695 RepID=A0A5A7T829_CUCMM|nr:putative acyl-activating enzyme 19 isoform X1 [Cucumis melo var. makuwa]
MKQPLCCISHEFQRVALSHPGKIAVIHASGGVQLFRQLHGGGVGEADDFFQGRATSDFPPMYEGDRCFTYSQLLASVDSLSSRLLATLRRPQLNAPTAPRPANDQPAKTSPVANELSEASTELETCNIPKIFGIYMPPSVEYIISVLSVLRCGGAFMPLDPAWPKRRILSVVSSSKIDLIIYSGSSFCEDGYHVTEGFRWLEEISGYSTLCFTMEESSVREHNSAVDLVFPCEDEKARLFCYVMYTSGSTGKPKGICGTEQGLLNRFQWMQENFPSSREELLLFKTSISFIDHIQEFLSAILTSSVLVIPPMKELKENLCSVVNFIQAYSINKLTAVPSLMRTLLPALQRLCGVKCSLRLLILSGETLPIQLWDALVKLLPETTILNLYGSTEVSGDCTYFDCKKMPMILETDAINTIPIGVPISHCDVVVVGDNDALNQGELCVGGPCVCSGYYSDSIFLPLDGIKFSQDFIHEGSFNVNCSQIYIRTGDFVQQLRSGDLVFLGRKDRIIKVNGQRISLEEIEDALREHPDVVDAAVVSRKSDWELEYLVAFLVLKDNMKSEVFRSPVRSWMVEKVSLAMIPNSFFFIDSIPKTTSGKVDYEILMHSRPLWEHVHESIDETWANEFLQIIKKAFSDALMVEEISSDDDFFTMGGNSITAALVSHRLGVDMRWLYHYPSPAKLLTVILEKKGLDIIGINGDADSRRNLKTDRWNKYSLNDSEFLNHFDLKEGGSSGKRKQVQPNGGFSRAVVPRNNNSLLSKHCKVVSDHSINLEDISQVGGHLWNSPLTSVSCAFSRCNKVVYEHKYIGDNECAGTLSVKSPRGEIGSMKKLWQVHMESCVDASPLLVFKHPNIYLFIGSHSHKFVCVDAKNASLHWEIRLEGRIECSAAIVGDFSQVVVGCYKGKIYFLEFSTGVIQWTFQTSGEVKSQPVVDPDRNLIWCGSYDHNLYALDYVRHSCVYKLPCGGSLYGSPAIDVVNSVSHFLFPDFPFHSLWHYDLEAPVFGSLAIDPFTRNVICCLVDGHVVALDSRGSVSWKSKTGGPIFAGPCISTSIPSQVLICSRNGSIYSFELESGDLVWEYNIGNSITASACVDEHLQLVPETSISSDRLICVCSSAGSVHLLRVKLNATQEGNYQNTNVEEFGRLDLEEDIFSSPVMIGGLVFVGCRDDYVHCVGIDNLNTKRNSGT